MAATHMFMPKVAIFSILSGVALSSPSARLLERDDYAGDLSGCGISHDFVGRSQDQNNYQYGDHSRDYLVHLPASYSADTPTPLVLAFHGHGVDRFFAQDDYAFSSSDGDTDFTDGKIYVYPQGIDGTDGLPSWAGAPYATTSKEEDIGFIGNLLDHLRTRYCIDSARIYATGHSNGGGFTNSLACNADVGANFAAFAPASGAYYDDNSGPDDGCSPARNVTPMLESHGGADKTIYYPGGNRNGGYLPNIADWISWWAQRNGCQTDAFVEDSDNGDVHHSTWNGCSGGDGVVQHWKIDDMDHVWPSTEHNADQDNTHTGPAPIEFSRLVLDFFNAHTRPA